MAQAGYGWWRPMAMGAILVWIWMAAGGVRPSYGQQGDLSRSESEGEEVTVITSERLTFDYQKQYAVFDENVVVTDPDMRLTSNRLAVWFDEDGEVYLIKAEGNVFIEQEDKIATAGEATYDVPTGKIVLVKSPRLQRGRHFLEATTITYWRNEELLIAEPQPKLVIYPEGGGERVNLLGR